MDVLINSAAYIQTILRTFEGVLSVDASRSPGAHEYFKGTIAVLICLTLVAASVMLGWFVMWNTALKSIGFFRELMGLNRGQNAQAKQKAALEIEKIRRELSRNNRAGSMAAQPRQGQ